MPNTKISRDALGQFKRAGAKDSLKMILEFGDVGSKSVRPAVNAEDFKDRTAYRQALIAAQTEKTAPLADVVKRLNDLGLTVDWGGIAPVAVVRGSKEQLLKAVEDPDVKRLTPDREMSLIEPVDEEGEPSAGKPEEPDESNAPNDPATKDSAS